MACTRRASSGRKATNASEAAHRRAAPQAPRVRHRPPHPAPAALPAPPSPAACIPRCGAPATHPPTHLHVQRLCRFVQIQQPPLRLIHQADELSGEQAQAGVVTAACTRVGRCSRGTVGSRCCPTGCTRHGRLAAGSAYPYSLRFKNLPIKALLLVRLIAIGNESEHTQEAVARSLSP